jgi:hypothetical protein
VATVTGSAPSESATMIWNSGLARGRDVGDLRAEGARGAGEFFVDEVGNLVRDRPQLARVGHRHVVADDRLAAEHVEQREMHHQRPARLAEDLADDHVVHCHRTPVAVIHLGRVAGLFQHVRGGQRLEQAAARQVRGDHVRELQVHVAGNGKRHHRDRLGGGLAAGHGDLERSHCAGWQQKQEQQDSFHCAYFH